MSQIQLSQQIYEQVAVHAAQRNKTPDTFVEDLLIAQLRPAHPYIEMIHSRSEARAVVKGTRVGVDVIVGYLQAGCAPQEIATDILPQLTLAQIYDALSYYEDHQTQIDRIRKNHTPQLWRTRLKQRLGEEDAAQLLGE